MKGLRRACRTLLCAIIGITAMLSGLPSSAEVRAQANVREFDTQKLDAFMETSMQSLNIPGAAIAVVKGDQAVYWKGYGVSGPDKKPVTPQTPFVLGSTSKSFTAVAVMQLAEEGRIDLDAPVQRYLPWFRVADEEASEKITVKHLLHQTSGLSTYSGQVSLAKGNKTLESHIRGLKDTALTEPVGSVFQYSNTNYDILGAIIQEVSHMPYTEYVKQRIYEPLDMQHSYASPEEGEGGGLATGYQPVFGWMVPTKQLEHQGTVPSGYLISSSEDMSKYLIAHMNGGRYGDTALLSEQSVGLLHKPAASMWGDAFYAMGWTVEHDKLYHDGSTENTYSKMVIDGEYGVILLINAMDFFHIDSYDSIMTGIVGMLQGQDPPKLESSEYKQTYMVLDIAAAAVLIYLAFSIYRLFKWRTRFHATALRIGFHFLFVLLINWLVPIGLLLAVPKLLVPWPVVMAFLPGFGHFMFVIPVLLISVGLIKVILILRSIAGKRKKVFAH
ncbi:class A beta-lactamase-related serine hydrolase [Paenibacillus nanensis]|uniref:Class A beta-lactamase-related serine hydrolase n=1 Tax=Paenibacillus nanensis TaxID=393251 RepID=A0A3A1UPT4_9BACL|nr:serine hydrolase domain-containing protein [Paenibacillus nanensis]RIX50498.1 class A beta-lactamase-related serine hydrolase [Paenibacillus nanensis]